jgi:hypothetical protein
VPPLVFALLDMLQSKGLVELEASYSDWDVSSVLMMNIGREEGADDSISTLSGGFPPSGPRRVTV